MMQSLPHLHRTAELWHQDSPGWQLQFFADAVIVGRKRLTIR
ncbi:hypothetical protein ODJ79_46100 [Actinoplanes sp. KI2]|nr:hypothetical protein [Actinoplanes sp. KI2]MCU7731130.1 hypothetical protein [Actinoplanes sp. KI2]